MRPHSISATRRFKRALAICAVAAVGAAGAAASHAEAGQPTPSLGAHGGQLELGVPGGALTAIARSMDETPRETAERRGRAAAAGGREARGREAARDEDG